MLRIMWTRLSLWVSLFCCFFPLSYLSSSCTSTCPLPPGAFFFYLELSKAQQDKRYCYSVGYCSLYHVLPFHCWNKQHYIKLMWKDRTIAVKLWEADNVLPICRLMNMSKGVSSPIKIHPSSNSSWLGQCLFAGCIT